MAAGLTTCLSRSSSRRAGLLSRAGHQPCACFPVFTPIRRVPRCRFDAKFSELTDALTPLGRHAVLKHVGVLEGAGLIVSRKEGRVRRCHLNPVPIVELAQRWIDDFGARASGSLLALKTDLEKGTHP